MSRGHFSFLNKDLMISDTYHDNNFESNLFSYNMKDKNIKKIKKFKCIKEIRNKSYRCDLHPRIVFDKEIIMTLRMKASEEYTN